MSFPEPPVQLQPLGTMKCKTRSFSGEEGNPPAERSLIVSWSLVSVPSISEFRVCLQLPTDVMRLIFSDTPTAL